MKKISLSLLLMASIIIFLCTCIKEEELIIQLPTISTLPITDITVSSAYTGGNITNNGGSDITSRGIVWNIVSEPSLENFMGFTTEGSGAGVFQSAIYDLKPETRYYVRAYATNNKGVAYGNEVSLTTQEGLYQIQGYVRNSTDNIIKGATIRLGNKKSAAYGKTNYEIPGLKTGIHSEFEFHPSVKLKKTSASPFLPYHSDVPILDRTTEISSPGPEPDSNHFQSNKSLSNISVFTDENGYYKLEGVRNGKYNIVVEMEDYEIFTEELTVSGSDIEKNISLKASELPQIRNVVINPENNNINVTWQALSNHTLKGYNHFEQHFFWHNGEWTENQYYIFPKFSSWNKTNSNLITGVASTNYSSPCYNGIIHGKVFGVNIDEIQTPENSSTIIKQKNLPSKVKALASFGLEYTAAIDIPETSHEIVLHMGYYYNKFEMGVVDFAFNYDGQWVVKVSEKASSSWNTVGSHGLPQGSFMPSGNHGHTITISLNDYKGKTIYLKTEPAGNFQGLTIQHNLMQYSLDGSNF